MNSILIASSIGETTDWIRRTGGTVETAIYDEKPVLTTIKL